MKSNMSEMFTTSSSSQQQALPEKKRIQPKWRFYSSGRIFVGARCG